MGPVGRRIQALTAIANAIGTTLPMRPIPLVAIVMLPTVDDGECWENNTLSRSRSWVRVPPAAPTSWLPIHDRQPYAAVAQSDRAGTFSRSLSPLSSVFHPSSRAQRRMTSNRFHLVGRECRWNYTLLMSGSRVRIPLVAGDRDGSSVVEQVFRHSCRGRRHKIQSFQFRLHRMQMELQGCREHGFESRPLAGLGRWPSGSGRCNCSVDSCR